MVLSGYAPPEMVSEVTSEPAFLECLGEMLRFMDMVPEAVLFPHIERCIEGTFRVRIVGAFLESSSELSESDFVILLHRTLIIYNFEVEIFHLLTKMHRDCIGFDSASNRRVGRKHLARLERAEYEVAKSST